MNLILIMHTLSDLIEKEIWVPIGNKEYWVSNYGSIRSHKKIIFNGKGSYGIITNEPQCLMKLKINRGGYFYITPYINGKRFLWKIHKLVAGAFLGPCPEGMIIDHIDKNTTNNFFFNLRYTTHSKNNKNKLKSAVIQSKYCGVFWDIDRGMWCTTAHINGKTRFFGRFDIEEDAAKAYDQALIDGGITNRIFNSV